MSTKVWTGYVVVTAASRSRTKLRDRLVVLRDHHQARGLAIQFGVQPPMIARIGGLKGAGAVLTFTATNDDPNRIPTDIDRAVTAAMGDATCAITVLVSENPIGLTS